MDYRTGKAGLIGTVLWLSLAMAAHAGERVYGAEPMESHWQVASDGLACRLNHIIPSFGQASFVQGVNEPLRFELRMLRRQRAGEVALRAIPPEWHPGSLIEELGDVQLARGASRLRVDDGRAEWLLSELEDGVYPAIFFPETLPGRGGVSVVLSGVRFRDALDEFMECRAKLLKVDVAALRTKTLHFATNRYSLTERDRRALRPLANYVRSGDGGRKVVVEARADARGSAQSNDRLSLRRAQAVRDYLVARGVSRQQIQISALGERKPVANNRTAAGRAENRRADVRVVD